MAASSFKAVESREDVFEGTLSGAIFRPAADQPVGHRLAGRRRLRRLARLGCDPDARARARRAVPRRLGTVSLRLEHLRLRRLQTPAGRGERRGAARGSSRRRAHRRVRELRAAQGSLRDGGRASVGLSVARRSPRPDRRLSRPHRALHVLASPVRPRRRSSRPSPARPPYAVCRRPRPGEVPRRCGNRRPRSRGYRTSSSSSR